MCNSTNSSLNQLVIINEKLVDFDELLKIGFNLWKTVSEQGWSGYFEMLSGFTYPSLVKEFWINASIVELNSECAILSRVTNISITVTSKAIANVIICGEIGEIPGTLVWDYYLPTWHIFVDPSKTSEVSNLLPEAVVWCQLLNSNLLPKDKDLDLVDPIEQDLLLFLNSDLKIDLPQVMFDHLKRTLSSFQKGRIFSIPFGRVILELLVQ